MPVDAQKLFLDKVLREEIAKYRFDNSVLDNLCKVLEKYQLILKRDGELGESEQRQKFLSDILQILGYENDLNFRFEGKTEVDQKQPDARLGSNLINSGVEVVVEWKGSKVNLDQLKENPVIQAWGYVSGFDGCQWYIVGNFREIRLYHRSHTRGEYQSYFLKDLVENKEILKEFWFLFARENLLKNSREKSYLDEIIVQNQQRKDEITNQFYREFKHYRFVIFNHLRARFADIDKFTILSKTQSILDKITFIQFASSRRLLPANLLQVQTQIAKSIPQYDDRFWYILKGLFRSVDEGNSRIADEIFGYNGELFKYDLELEKISINDEILEEVFGFFTKYDFNNELTLDVLGRVFEQSISDIEEIKKEIEVEATTASPYKASGNTVVSPTIPKTSKRKKDGIFYTPEYITKYISETVINLYLQENPDKITKDRIDIKILDPACGSGAFLNQAHTVLKEKYYQFLDKNKFEDIGSEFGAIAKEYDEYEINQNLLHNNIFGVDLNPESVEISKLSLWLKTIEKKKKMRTLASNIKRGNSLIDDPEIAGDLAFDWNSQFEEIMKNGNFDVIVGNPPYGADLSQNEQDYLLQKYNFGTTETAILFVLKALDLIKDGGYIGFIIPKSFCFASNYQKIRELIWDNVVQIVDCGKVWNEVKLEQIIVIIQKGVKHSFYINKIRAGEKFENEIKIDKNIAKEFGFFLNGISENDIKKADKIKQNSVMLNEIAENRRGAMLQKFISNEGELEVIGGAEISRNGIVGIKGKINKADINDEKAYIKPNSILVQNIVAHIENPEPHIKITACIAEKTDYILVDTINQITLKKGFLTKFVWAILNSEICNWYVYNFVIGRAIRTIHLDSTTTSQLPIPVATSQEQTKIADLVDRIMALKKEMQDYLKNTFVLWEAELNQKIKLNKKLEKFWNLDFGEFLTELTKQKIEPNHTQKRNLLLSFEADKNKLLELESEVEKVGSLIEVEVRKLYKVD